MADPYASVAETYDIMIDWPSRLARERPFFAWLLAQGDIRRVLDVGCGTGHHTRLFAEMGVEVIGIDPSGPMLARARALTQGDNPRFLEGGFTEIPRLSGQFDLIVVLGNTLSYVRDAADLLQTLRAIRAKLHPGGLFCAQTINYDNLITMGSLRLPLIHRQVEGREYLFLREYRRLDAAAEFTLITLTGNDQWQQSVERSRHFPITGDMLASALSEVGFSRITLYGGYDRSPFDSARSGSLTAVAVG